MAPTAASAQSSATDQYGGVGPGSGNGADNPNGGDGPAADLGAGTASGTGESGGGDLPFTGYPLTPLVALFLLLLAAGLVIRLISTRRTPSAASAGPRLR